MCAVTCTCTEDWKCHRVLKIKMRIRGTLLACTVVVLLSGYVVAFWGADISKSAAKPSWNAHFSSRLSRPRAALMSHKRLTDSGALIDNVDVFIFDCDGVIWRGDSLIPGVPGILDKLRSAGKRCFFVTNNSTKSRKDYKKKFDELGLNVPPEEIFSSSFAAAAYFEQTKFKETGKKVYIIGERGIEEELALIGIPYIGGEADKDTVATLGPGQMVHHDPDVGAVVVGFDRFISYYKIQYAQLCINENKGCQFIATNLDAVTHLTDAQEWAGNGSMVGAIKGCTGKEPTVVGKPAPLMVEYICDKFGVKRERICMVGDRLDTDVLFGNNNGMKSCLVLSGVTSEKKLLNPKNKIVPDYYCDSICDFFPEVIYA